jgi:hypothetical protein
MTPISDEGSIRWLIRSITSSIFDGVRRNRLAAVLAMVTACSLIVFAVSNRLHGLHEYQDFTLPRLLRLETGFLGSLRMAENASGEWRAYYFKEAHSQVRDILRAARLDPPKADDAQSRHQQFIRYYESIDTTFHSIETELIQKSNLNYILHLREQMNQLSPIRDAWFQWTQQQRENARRVE